MDTPQQVLEHERITISRVALSWLGLILMLLGIVCAFRFYICGVVLAVIGAASYIEAVRKIQTPAIPSLPTDKQAFQLINRLKKGEKMSEKTYSGLSRKEINWYPKINSDLCTGCGVCVEFCHEHVYDKQGNKAVVARPYDCLVGCESCRPRCPVAAISFPSRQELKQMLRALREKYGYQGVSEAKAQ